MKKYNVKIGAEVIELRLDTDALQLAEDIMGVSTLSIFAGGEETEAGKKQHMMEQLGKIKYQHAFIYAGTRWAGITQAKVKEELPFSKLSDNIQPVMWAVMSAMGYDIEAEAEADETGNPKGRGKKSPKRK